MNINKFVLCSALIMLFFLSFYVYTFDASLQHTLMRQHAELKEESLNIKQSMLRLKYREELNYDGLNRYSDDFQNTIIQLKSSVDKLANKQDAQELNRLVSDIHLTSVRYRDLIEKFKSHLAVLNNSFYYFKYLTHSIAEYNFNEETILLLYHLQHDIYDYYNNNQSKKKAIFDGINALEQHKDALQERQQHDLNRIIQYTQLVVEYSHEINAIWSLGLEISAIESNQLDYFQQKLLAYSLKYSYKASIVEDVLVATALFTIFIIISLIVFIIRKSSALDDALRNIENQQFALNQHAIVSSTDTKGNIKYVNDKFCCISGFERSELIGKNHRIINSGYHSTAFFEDMWKTLYSGEVWHGEVRNKAKEGGYYWVRASIVPIFDRHHNLDEFIAIRTDITLIKTLEEELNKGQIFLTQMTDAMAQGMYAMDSAGNCTFWNKEAERLLGISKEELLGTNIHEHIHYQDSEGNHVPRADCLTKHCMDRKELFHSETDVFTRKNGEIFPISITAVPLIENGELMGSVAVFSDISKRKQEEAVLNKALLDAELANQAKSDFLANMSHEIRTPMNGIIGMTDLALETDLPAEQKEYMKIVKQSAAALITIINDILDFSKIESGKLELEAVEFNLHQVLRLVVQSLASKASAKGLKLKLNIARDVPFELVGDYGRLRQIIINLIGNAIKFTAQGIIYVNVEVRAYDDTQVDLVFSVKDNGIGIPKDRQDSIFSSFSQVDSSISRKFGGTGLGLTISRQLVYLMKGNLWLESEEGTGSTFFFNAKFIYHQDADLLDYKDDLGAKTALILENDNEPRLFLQETLERWGMLVSVASNYIEARNFIDKQTSHFDLVLLAPSEDNNQQQEVIDKIALSPFILLLEADKLLTHYPQYKHFKYKGVLNKPLDPSELLDEVHNVLGGCVSNAYEQDVIKKTIKLTILVAEDNKVNQMLAINLLEKQDHQVTIAENGQEAIEKYQQGAFDLILMDFQMPIMGGLEATEAIRKLEQQSGENIIIIAMTANAMAEDRQRALDAGMNDYISKPIDSHILFEKLSFYFDDAEVAMDVEIENENVTVKNDKQDPLVICDWQSAVERMGDDEEILMTLADIYHEEYLASLANINHAYQQKEREVLARELHTLKGMVSNFSSNSLVKLLQALETQCLTELPTEEQLQFSHIEDLAIQLHKFLKDKAL